MKSEVYCYVKGDKSYFLLSPQGICSIDKEYKSMSSSSSIQQPKYWRKVQLYQSIIEEGYHGSKSYRLSSHVQHLDYNRLLWKYEISEEAYFFEALLTYTHVASSISSTPTTAFPCLLHWFEVSFLLIKFSQMSIQCNLIPSFSAISIASTT